ncbi:MAG: hypothetical protein H6648_07840 [Caldilineae bacterium]|nr:hypothetical protein [Chloroflexota bacterium]MCB9177055.1 hypothetical protein [Caldilineae bacterium]
MNISAPTQMVFIVSVVLALLGILGVFNVVAALAGYATWLLILGWVVLAVGCLVKGL